MNFFAKTIVLRSIRSVTLDLVTPAAGIAAGIALFDVCWIGLRHAPLGIAFACALLLGALLAIGRVAVDIARGKSGTQGDFALFATFGYLATYAIGLLARSGPL